MKERNPEKFFIKNMKFQRIGMFVLVKPRNDMLKIKYHEKVNNK